MISKLRISNFALIEHLELDLENGFTIVTGETGSGKSILLNAFSLMLGERASNAVIGSYSKKAIVELKLNNTELDHSFFEKHNLDSDKTTILRRELVKDGKSRAFINDTPVSLSVLKEFTRDKLLIHSQYNTYELKSKQTQLELFDSLSGITERVQAYSALYHKMLHQKEALSRLVIQFSKKSKDTDYNQFLYDELNKLQLDQRNYSNIESELYKLENIDEIKEALFKIKAFNEEQGVYSNMKDILKQLNKLEQPSSEIEDIISRLDELSVELKEISNESEFIIESIIDDPERKSELIDTIDEYNRMLQKHHVGSQKELIEIRDRLSHSSLDLIDLDSKIKQMERGVKELEVEVLNKADSIHQFRIKSRKRITELIINELKLLKLPHTAIYFDLKKGELSETGNTTLNLLFSANLGHPQIEIEKAASGGELSRFMLALLKLISESRNMPTILFDEIDAGVSGDVAQKIGQLLKNMGAKTQLLVISHLPQVASKAKQHFMVHKEIIENKTSTTVDLLNEDERIREIARLMSGENVTKSALETAKSLMK
jgi:DNA repair protein RecN (Recombination protein N)